MRQGSATEPQPLPVDFHVHLANGLTVEEAVRLARERGAAIGIVEHGGVGQVLPDDDALLGYVAKLRDQSVYAGLQAEGPDWMSCFSEDAVAELDYVLTDALTLVDSDGRRLQLWRPEVEIPDAGDFIEQYIAFHVQIMDSQPIDIMANPTFLPACLANEYESLWTDERMGRIIEAAVSNDVALEINARYCVPSTRFVELAKGAGVTFCFGTNCHQEEDVGRLDYCLQVAAKCGLKIDELFRPRSGRRKANEAPGR